MVNETKNFKPHSTSTNKSERNLDELWGHQVLWINDANFREISCPCLSRPILGLVRDSISTKYLSVVGCVLMAERSRGAGRGHLSEGKQRLDNGNDV